MNHARPADRGATCVAALRSTAVNRVLAGGAATLSRKAARWYPLMRGQPDTPTPAHIVEAAQRALRDGRTGYPDNQGEPGLRAAVAEKLARTQHLTYDPSREILVTDGATCGISTALAALLEPGDEVLLPDPVYDAYSSPIAFMGRPGRAGAVTDTREAICRRSRRPRSRMDAARACVAA